MRPIPTLEVLWGLLETEEENTDGVLSHFAIVCSRTMLRNKWKLPNSIHKQIGEQAGRFILRAIRGFQIALELLFSRLQARQRRLSRNGRKNRFHMRHWKIRRGKGQSWRNYIYRGELASFNPVYWNSTRLIVLKNRSHLALKQLL